jgi:hypothetical protein
VKGFKFEPVRWATAILTLLVALESVQQFVELIPEKTNGYVLIAIAILTAILGERARSLVTALAAPRDNKGRPLIPVTPPVRADKTGL